MKLLLDQDVYGVTAKFLADSGYDLNAVHKELIRILDTYAKQDLSKTFIVVKSDGHRRRQL